MELPRSIGIVEDLLQGTNEWRNIQEIVKLTFRAFLEVVKSQNASIEDLERELLSRVSREELQSKLSAKANILDVQQTFSHIQGSFDVYEKEDVRFLVDQSIRECRAFVSEGIEKISQVVHEKVSWKDIEPVLEDKVNLQAMNTAMQRKVNKTDLEALLTLKADASDVHHIIQKIDKKIDQKPTESPRYIDDSLGRLRENLHSQEENLNALSLNLTRLQNDLENLRKSMGSGLSKKADLSDIENIYSVLSSKAEYEPTMELIDRVRRDLIDLKHDVKKEKGKAKAEDFTELRIKVEADLRKLWEQVNGLNDARQMDSEEYHRYLKTAATSTRNEMLKDIATILETTQRLEDELMSLSRLKADKTDLNAFKSSLETLDENKASPSEIRDLIKTPLQELTSAFDRLKVESTDRYKDCLESLGDKVSTQMLEISLKQKMNVSDCMEQLNGKVNTSEFEKILQDMISITSSLSSKLTSSDFDRWADRTKTSLERLEQEMVLKSNFKDVCALLDMKVNIDDYDKINGEIQTQVSQKLPLEKFNSSFSAIQRIIETLCTENCIGRWIWKSGELKSGSLIPWESQSINSAPDNFLWDKNKTSVLTVAPGLYEIRFGVYARKRPTVQVIVNGDPAIAVGGTSTPNQLGVKVKTSSNHPCGQVTGLTYVDFLSLPPRGRIALSFNCETQGEGFLSLKKL